MGDSFAKQVKIEILTQKFSTYATKAVLSAIIKFLGSISYTQSRVVIIFKSSSMPLIKFAYLNIKHIYNVEIEIACLDNNTLTKDKTYEIKVVDGVRTILNDLEILNLTGKIIYPSDKNWRSDEYTKSYIIGAFLATGSINPPTTSNYHLEMVSDDETIAHKIIKVLERYNLFFKIGTRRKKTIIYLKKSDAIGDFLKLINARDTMFKFEDIRIQRDILNFDNRLSNCDVANSRKSINNGLKQVRAIEKLIEFNLLSTLDSSLQLIAKLRLENPEDSLYELADKHNQLYSEAVTKSQLNHKLLKLVKLSENL